MVGHLSSTVNPLYVRSEAFGMPRNGCSAWSGTGVRHAPESAFGFGRNRCSPWPGTRIWQGGASRARSGIAKNADDEEIDLHT